MTLALKVDAIENIQKYRFFKGFLGKVKILMMRKNLLIGYANQRNIKK